VRKSGNQVRITVQLIDARTDTHLWSETYDRPLENIFAIQDEIAAAVVAQLKVTLLGAAPKTAVTNPEAYALFLRGRELYRVGSREAYLEAIDLFKRALELSPDYAPAWRMLGSTYVNQSGRGMREVEEGMRLGREAANRALALQPDYAPAEADLGVIANAYDRDMRAAVRHTERALALDPGNIDALITAGLTARSLGRLDLALALHQRQLELDPANPGPYAQIGQVYAFLGRDREAIASYRKAFELSPGFVGVRHWLSLVLLGDGRDRARAEQALALASDEPSDSYRLLTQAMAYHALGRKTESDAAMAEVERRFQRDLSYNIAYAYVFRGEPDRAFAALEHAAEYNDSGLSEVFSQPMFAPLRGDPRWLPYLHKIGRDPAELAAIPFQVALPDQPGTTAAGPGAAQ
jgi:tetratricopeptide (TPR) repeat protein